MTARLPPSAIAQKVPRRAHSPQPRLSGGRRCSQVEGRTVLSLGRPRGVTEALSRWLGPEQVSPKPESGPSSACAAAWPWAVCFLCASVSSPQHGSDRTTGVAGLRGRRTGWGTASLPVRPVGASLLLQALPVLGLQLCGGIQGVMVTAAFVCVVYRY